MLTGLMTTHRLIVSRILQKPLGLHVLYTLATEVVHSFLNRGFRFLVGLTVEMIREVDKLVVVSTDAIQQIHI
jgi:hypothetical protein